MKTPIRLQIFFGPKSCVNCHFEKTNIFTNGNSTDHHISLQLTNWHWNVQKKKLVHTDRATIWRVFIWNSYFSFFQIWLSLKMMNVHKFKSTMISKFILRRIWIRFNEMFSFYLARYLALIFFEICCENSNMTSKRILPRYTWKQCDSWKQQQLKLGFSVL